MQDNLVYSNVKKYLSVIPKMYRYYTYEEITAEVNLYFIENNIPITQINIEAHLPKIHAKMSKEYLNLNPEARQEYNFFVKEYTLRHPEKIQSIQKKYHDRIKEELTDTYVRILLKQSGYSHEYILRHPELIEAKRQVVIKKRQNEAKRQSRNRIVK